MVFPLPGVSLENGLGRSRKHFYDKKGQPQPCDSKNQGALIETPSSRLLLIYRNTHMVEKAPHLLMTVLCDFTGLLWLVLGKLEIDNRRPSHTKIAYESAKMYQEWYAVVYAISWSKYASA